VENLEIARVLREIADLLELKGENPFKIRAYRGGADTVAAEPGRVAALDQAGLRGLPGIGKDLALRIGELVATGRCSLHDELLTEFPAGVLEMLTLQGVGPKTVALLYKELGIASLDALAASARRGQLRAVKGMGAKKEAQILAAIEQRQERRGRRLLADVHEIAAAVVDWLGAQAPGVDLLPVGSLRRGAETCGDLDILAVGGGPEVMDAFVRYPRVERVLAHGGTKASVLLAGGFQADLRLVPAASRGAAMQYFTGSRAHNIALRDRALSRGLTLNEYGLTRLDASADGPAGQVVAGRSEEDIYEALGLAWVPPELREDHGELAAAEARTLPRLIDVRDLRGDVHMHSTATDGKDTIERMALAARDAGLEYIAITDHSKALAMANGLDEARALEHAARIRALNGRIDGITVLAGIECDILADGRLDLDDECLRQLDLVVASVHSAMGQEADEITARICRAIANPWVDVVGHPTSRLLLRRSASKADVGQVIAAAAAHGVALEINSQVDRLDLPDVHARLARDRGVPLVISSDAHSTAALANTRWGVTVARRAWLTPADVLTTRPLDAFRRSLRRHRAV
jgi:DNA polymerase (family 10)